MKTKKEIVTLIDGTTIELSLFDFGEVKQEPITLKWMLPNGKTFDTLDDALKSLKKGN